MSDDPICTLCGRRGHRAPQCPWVTGAIAVWKGFFLLVGFCWGMFASRATAIESAIDAEDSKRGDL